MYTMTVGYFCNLLPFNWVVFCVPSVITDNTNGTMGLHRGSNGYEPQGTQRPTDSRKDTEGNHPEAAAGV